MILLEIKEYLKRQKQASLQDVCVKFNLSEEAAKEMLAHWERKGKIERVEKKCSGCSCAKSGGECVRPCGALYRWKTVNM